MTPKDYAIELVDRYYSVKWHNGKKVCSITKQAAKDCALIAVDEIMELMSPMVHSKQAYDYWDDVKQEIEKL
jgi:hypothetical protein